MQAEKMRKRVVAALEEGKGHDIRVLDVRKITDLADYMVVVTGTSDRHVKSLADRVVDDLREHGVRALGVEGEEVGDWVLADFGDVVVHVMRPQTRAFYDLEKLWSSDLRATRETEREKA